MSCFNWINGEWNGKKGLDTWPLYLHSSSTMMRYQCRLCQRSATVWTALDYSRLFRCCIFETHWIYVICSVRNVVVQMVFEFCNTWHNWNWNKQEKKQVESEKHRLETCTHSPSYFVCNILMGFLQQLNSHSAICQIEWTIDKCAKIEQEPRHERWASDAWISFVSSESKHPWVNRRTTNLWCVEDF